MCEECNCCQKSEQLTGKPQDCTTEQIKECHGDSQEHPCVTDSKN